VSGPAAVLRPSLHRYAVAVAVATGLLVFVGGLVTSTGSALAVPDWPLSFGKLFPRMTGGVLFEHGHRMVAATVGLLTIGLAIWLWRAETRRWVRWLGVAALATVVLQGVLGGLTVLLRLPVAVAVSHAGLAEVFFCLTVTIALVTSPGWLAAPHPDRDAGAPPLRTLSVVTVAVVYVQILIGALVRHTGSGLAIPDFPLAFGHLWPPAITRPIAYQLAHRLGALAVSVSVLWTAWAALRRHGGRAALRRPALLLVLLLAWQIYLGAAIIWTRRAVMPTTTHVVSGALILVTSLVLALRSHRFLVRRGEAEAAPATAPTASATA
jgi:cytochrome c oxidase assembly protein subunit 15